MSNVPLDIFDGVAGVALIPPPIEVLGDNPQLDDQTIGEVLGLRLATLFAP